MNSGYISFCEGAVIVHYSDKNAYAAAYNSFKTDINAVDIISSLNFPEVRSEIMLNDYDEFPVLYGICIARALSAIIYAFFDTAEVIRILSVTYRYRKILMQDCSMKPL